MNRFRLATYNVHKCRGIDWRLSLPRIVKVLQEVDADIFAVQEIFEKQAACLAERLELTHVFGAARRLGEEEYGNAVFSRYRVVASSLYDLTVEGREPRKCLHLDIELQPSRVLHLFALHLGTSFFERRRQAGKLLSQEVLARSGLSGPRVVMGDFNEWTRGLVSRTLAQHMHSADLTVHLKWGRTYPGVIPFLHLDHIYYDDPLKLVNMRLHRTPASLTGSDHLPLIGEFEWL